MAGLTATLGNSLAQLGRIVLGEAPDVPVSLPAFLPLLVVEFSPTTGPMDAPLWVDISQHVMAFSCARGRQRDTDRVEAGTLTLTLANTDRRFDPLNASGPYFGSLIRRRRIRVRAAWDGIMYPLWSGYIEKWGAGLWSYGRQTTTLTATDGFDLLGQKRVSGTFPEQTTGQRIGAVLDAAAWSTGQGGILNDATYGLLDSTMLLTPVSQRSISQGQTTVQAVDLSNTSALQQMQTMAQTEQGLVFIAADGTVTFHHRHQRAYPRAISATFGADSAAGELPYTDAAIDDRPGTIYNEVKITRSGGAEQIATDQPAIDEFFGQTFSATLPLLTDVAALGYAEWMLARSMDFPIRVAGLTLAPTIDTRLWPMVLGLELSDKVRVRYRPDVGSEIDQTSWVERVEHAYDAGRAAWVATLAITPGAEAEAFILQTSVLDSAAWLVY